MSQKRAEQQQWRQHIRLDVPRRGTRQRTEGSLVAAYLARKQRGDPSFLISHTCNIESREPSTQRNWAEHTTTKLATAGTKTINGEEFTGDISEACEIEGTDEAWKKNCSALFESGAMPKNALAFALKTMKENESEFNTNRCHKLTSSSHYSMKGTTKSSLAKAMQNGIPNKC